MRVTDGPVIDPADLFDPNIEHLPKNYGGMVQKYGVQTIAGLLGYASVWGHNVGNNLPRYANKWAYVVSVAFWVGFATKGKSMWEEKSKIRNYKMWQYIKDHPEDFPLIERKLWRDEFLPWNPHR